MLILKKAWQRRHAKFLFLTIGLNNSRKRKLAGANNYTETGTGMHRLELSLSENMLPVPALTLIPHEN
mgnify:CR=1 FL=1